MSITRTFELIIEYEINEDGIEPITDLDIGVGSDRLVYELCVENEKKLKKYNEELEASYRYEGMC